MINTRKLTLLIFTISLFNLANSQNCLKYKVINIDSTKSTYLIKVKHKKSIDLIESPKKNLSSVKSEEKLIEGKSYKLKLSKSSLMSKRLGNTNNVYIDDRKVWSSKSDYDLLISKDLNGLYITVPCSCEDKD